MSINMGGGRSGRRESTDTKLSPPKFYESHIGKQTNWITYTPHTRMKASVEVMVLLNFRDVLSF